MDSPATGDKWVMDEVSLQTSETKPRRLHLGCGNNIFPGWINLDLAPLPGVDIVHDLHQFPWPFEDVSIDEVYMKDVLEHLPDTVRTMEELYRICTPGARLYIAVPYWNCFEAITDPTHVRFFNEFTFEFFDPTCRRCQNRPYYSIARFKIERLGFGIAPFKPVLRVPYLTRYYVVYNRFGKRILQALASFLNNVIIGLEVYLTRI